MNLQFERRRGHKPSDVIILFQGKEQHTRTRLEPARLRNYLLENPRKQFHKMFFVVIGLNSAH